VFANGGADYVLRVLAALEPQAGDRLVFLLDGTKTLPPGLAHWGLRPHVVYHRPEDIGDHLATGRYGTFFSGMPYNYGGVKAPTHVRLVYVIHGLRTLECPDDRYRIRFLGSAQDRAKERAKKVLFPGRERAKEVRRYRTLIESLTPSSTLVVVSEATGALLADWFPDQNLPIQTWYSPAPADPVATVPLPEARRDGSVLLLNSDRWVKNAPRAVRAWDRLVSQNPGWGRRHRLTVVGGFPKVFQREIRNPGAFVFLPYLASEDLVDRLRSAWALLYPSLSEGFGYPPLDALRVGTPVVASDLACLREVTGNAALRFDPYSLDAMAQALTQLEAEWPAWSAAGPGQERMIRERQQKDLSALCRRILG
jgi:glycosyltransferase involved in cell wall biosynthesis